MIFNMTSPGGSGIDLTIVGGESRPEVGIENMIYLKTTIPLEDTYIQNSSPNTSILNIGDVWINMTSGSNPDNTISVSSDPMLEIVIGNVKIWNGTDWNIPDVQIYKDGTWHSQVLYIYLDGIYSEYGPFNYFSSSNIQYENQVLNKRIKFTWTSSGSVYSSQILSPIDVTKYNTFKVISSPNLDSTNTNSQYAKCIGIMSTTPPTTGTYPTYNWTGGTYVSPPYISSQTWTNINQEMTTDISNISGNVYITVKGRTQLSGGTNLGISEISMYV